MFMHCSCEPQCADYGNQKRQGRSCMQGSADWALLAPYSRWHAKSRSPDSDQGLLAILHEDVHLRLWNICLWVLLRSTRWLWWWSGIGSNPNRLSHAWLQHGLLYISSGCWMMMLERASLFIVISICIACCWNLCLIMRIECFHIH